MRSRKRSSGVGYTATSMAVVLAIALGAMYVSERRARIDRVGAQAVGSDHAEVGPGTSRDDGVAAARSAARAVGHRTGHGEAGGATDATRRVSPGNGASAGTGGRGPSPADGARSTGRPVVEGSAAERGPAEAVVGRLPERAPQRPGPVAAPRPTPRAAGHPLLAADGPHRAVLPALPAAEIERLELAARQPGPLEVGPVRELDAPPVLVELPAAAGESRLRALSVRAEGAASLRLHFSRFDVGDAEVLVHASTADGPVVLGPFTGRGPRGRGEFWTGVVPGAEAVVEVSGGDGAEIVVDRALQAQLGAGASEDAVKAGDGLLTCHEDVMCHDVDRIARDSVGQLSFVEGSTGYVCTGALLADDDDETVVPYLLTAYHCISTQTVADTLNVTWLYQSSSCGAGDAVRRTSPMSSSGADIVKRNSGNDMTLLRLRDPVPPGVGFAGWTTSTGVSGAYGIHHPSGSYKRYTDLNAVGFCPNCLCHDPTDYDFYDMPVGQVQGGSSGSPVFDAQGRIAGQLKGRCPKNYIDDPDDMTCGTTGDYWAVYGEFQTTHGKIERWLEIGGTIRVDAAAGTGGQGTPSDPFGLLADAEAFAWDGSRIALSAGTYGEPVELTKQVTLVADGGVVTIGQ